MKEKPKASTKVRRFTPGVYAIVHVKTNAAYIGSSRRCVLNRFSWHLAKLRAGTHPSVAFQELWDKTETAEWEFRLLEICDSAERIEREEHWCSQFTKVICARPATGFENTIESRIKMRLGRQKYLQNPDARRSLSERAKMQHAAGKFGRATWAPGTKPKITEKTKQMLTKRMQAHIAAQTSEEMLRRSYCRKLFKDKQS